MENNWGSELSRIEEALAEREKILSTLPPDRLQEAYDGGELIGQRLLLIRALIHRDLDRLGAHSALLRGILAQADQPAAPRIVSAL